MAKKKVNRQSMSHLLKASGKLTVSELLSAEAVSGLLTDMLGSRKRIRDLVVIPIDFDGDVHIATTVPYEDVVSILERTKFRIMLQEYDGNMEEEDE